MVHHMWTLLKMNIGLTYLECTYFDVYMCVCVYIHMRMFSKTMELTFWECVYVCIHMCECTYICEYAYVYTYIPTHIHKYLRVRTCIHTYLNIYMYVYTHMYICIYVYIYMYIYIYIYLHIYTYALKIYSFKIYWKQTHIQIHTHTHTHIAINLFWMQCKGSALPSLPSAASRGSTNISNVFSEGIIRRHTSVTQVYLQSLRTRMYYI